MAKDGQERTQNAGFRIYLEFQAVSAKKQNNKLTFYDLQTCGLANSLDQIQWQWQEREISGENEENWELSWKRSLGRRVTDQFEVGNWHFAPRERRERDYCYKFGGKVERTLAGRKIIIRAAEGIIILYHSRGAKDKLNQSIKKSNVSNISQFGFVQHAQLDILWRYEATFFEMCSDWTKFWGWEECDKMLNTFSNY